MNYNPTPSYINQCSTIIEDLLSEGKSFNYAISVAGRFYHQDIIQYTTDTLSPSTQKNQNNKSRKRGLDTISPLYITGFNSPW